MKHHFVAFIIIPCLAFSCPLNAMTNNLITTNSVGTIKLQSTLKSVKNILNQYTFVSTTDGEGVPLTTVTDKHHLLFQLYTNDKKKIQYIEIFDSAYQTKNGVHVGMSITDIEKHYGKLKEIMRSEIESREYATFAKQPKELTFRIIGKNDSSAGIYSNENNTTKTYHPDAYLYSIFIGN